MTLLQTQAVFNSLLTTRGKVLSMALFQPSILETALDDFTPSLSEVHCQQNKNVMFKKRLFLKRI